MKKFISLMLCVILVFAVTAPAAYAVKEDEVYPIIIVPGYSSSALCRYDENGNQIHVWNIEMDKILTRILVNAAQLGKDIGSLAKGDAKKLADTVGEEFVQMFWPMGYDENGKPFDETVVTYYNKAENTNTKWLKENEDGKDIHEGEIMPYVTEYLGEKAEEWTFNFNTDFRQNAVDCAADLDRYVDDVLDYTGAEKVNLVAVSHGGQTSATYLALYGEKGKVNNAVLTVPAIGGALLAYDILTNQIEFDEETLLYFIQNGMMLEEDYDWLVKAGYLSFLDDVLYYLRPYVIELLGYWGSIWDFVPVEYYEELKASASDTFRNSAIIAKSDYFHNELRPNLNALLTKAENAGVNIYIIAGASWPSVTGSKVNSDAIVSVNSSTGATVAPYGMRFSDGYKTLNTTCADGTHNHLSPSMEIDASTGYLPETTWIVNGLFHGMTLKDDYSAVLLKMLVESDENITVHSFKEYPQFHYSMNVCDSVYAEFNSSVPGYIGAEDTSLIITNLSKKNNMQIASVSVDGIDIRFDLTKYALKTIAPGESIEVKFSGTLPKVSLTTANIKISYVLIGSVTPVNERNLTFTVMNGESKEYDFENPYTSLENNGGFKDHIAGSKPGSIFDKLGLTSFLQIIYNIVYNIIGRYVFPLIGKRA